MAADQLILYGTLIGGLFILSLSGDFLVRGAVSASRKLGISTLVTGIVIVGFGTSVPELFVTLGSSIGGAPGLALGNIIGSNIANVLLVLALPALFLTIKADALGLKRAVLLLMISTALWIIVTPILPLSPLVGVAFLAMLVGYTFIMIVSMRAAENEGRSVSLVDTQTLSWFMTGFLIAIGLVGLPLGAQIIVDSGIKVASLHQVPETIIGLSVLAIGTSLPELAATFAAAIRHRSDVVMGNIIGSNMFNLFGAGALAALFGPFKLAQSFHNYDHWALGLSTLILALFILPKKKVSRFAGIALLLLYALYLFGLMNDWNILGMVRGLSGL